jgi:hypothetical protein
MEGLEVEGETATDLYMTLGPPARLLKAQSSSEELGRLHRLCYGLSQHRTRDAVAGVRNLINW